VNAFYAARVASAVRRRPMKLARRCVRRVVLAASAEPPTLAASKRA